MERSIDGDMGDKMSKLLTFGKSHNDGPNQELYVKMEEKKGFLVWKFDVQTRESLVWTSNSSNFEDVVHQISMGGVQDDGANTSELWDDVVIGGVAILGNRD